MEPLASLMACGAAHTGFAPLPGLALDVAVKACAVNALPARVTDLLGRRGILIGGVVDDDNVPNGTDGFARRARRVATRTTTVATRKERGRGGSRHGEAGRRYALRSGGWRTR